MGQANTASGYGAVALGVSNTADTNFSQVCGQNGHAKSRPARVRSSSRFSAYGDAQTFDMVLRAATSDATPRKITLTDSNVAGIILQNNSAAILDILVVARDSSGNAASWQGFFQAKRSGTTITLDKTTFTQIKADPALSAATLALGTDGTNGSVTITGTGIAATSIKWVATVRAVEVVG